MSCSVCNGNTPLALCCIEKGGSHIRVAEVVMCPNCHAFYEIQALSWGAPIELDDKTLKDFYPNLYYEYRNS